MKTLPENFEAIDITDIKTNGRFVKDRLQSFKTAVKNPYYFRVKNTRVKIVFSDKLDAPTMETVLVNIAVSSKN
ncbi:MAG: hypothetical protein K2L42_02770 [Clostridia bacterium]|nr:hypothetical protein [Clostridia bacterium]